MTKTTYFKNKRDSLMACNSFSSPNLHILKITKERVKNYPRQNALLRTLIAFPYCLEGNAVRPRDQEFFSPCVSVSLSLFTVNNEPQAASHILSDSLILFICVSVR